MSMKENLCAINSNKSIIPSDKEKPRVRKSTEVFGSTERKRLANITNMQQPRMSMIDEKSQFIPASTKEYIDKLKKENMTLMKLLADRNKIIELSGIELHKLRVSVQKLQQQNIQLAQSNSQMLAELTVDKDRLKLLQHELGCKNGLLVAKGLELKERDEIIPSQKVEEVKMHNEKLDSSQAFRDNVKPVNINRRQLSKSLGPSTVKESKDKADNKRLCVRRQSARLKSQEPEPADGMSDVEPNTLAFKPLRNDGMEEDFAKSSTAAIKEETISGIKRIPMRRQSARFKSEEPKSAEDLLAVGSTEPVSGLNCDDHMQDDVLTSICLSEEKNDKAFGNRRLSARRQSARVKSEEPEPDKAMYEINTNDYTQNEVPTSTCSSVKKDSIEGNHAPNRDSQDFGRPSLGRPSRQAAKKVNSYKEAPVNVKMRRTE